MRSARLGARSACPIQEGDLDTFYNPGPGPTWQEWPASKNVAATLPRIGNLIGPPAQDAHLHVVTPTPIRSALWPVAVVGFVVPGWKRKSDIHVAELVTM